MTTAPSPRNTSGASGARNTAEPTSHNRYRFFPAAAIAGAFSLCRSNAEVVSLYDKLNCDGHSTGSIFAAFEVVPPALIELALERGRLSEAVALVNNLPSLSTDQRDRLIGATNPTLAATVARSRMVSQMDLATQEGFAYSESLHVRFSLAISEFADPDLRLTALVGRTHSGSPIGSLEYTDPDTDLSSNICGFIKDLSPQQLDVVSTSVVPMVLAENLSNISTTAHLANVVTAALDLFDYLVNSPELSPSSQLIPDFTDQILPELRALLDRMGPALPTPVASAAAAIADELRFCEHRIGTRLPHRWSSIIDRDTVEAAVKVLAASLLSLEEDLALLSPSELNKWVTTASRLSTAQAHVILDRAATDMASYSLRLAFPLLPSSLVLEALAVMLPLHLYPWRPDLPEIITLTQAAPYISISQMFMYPPEQIAEFLAGSTLSVPEILELDESMEWLSPATLYVLSR